MSIVRVIHKATKENHDKLSNHPFVKRYNDKITVEDHYQHLAQLLPIYQALESGLVDNPLIASLPEPLKPLLQRSEAIKQDMAWLKKKKPDLKEPVITSATSNYVTLLNGLATTHEHEVMMGHYLARILGDMLGGQKVKGDVACLYKREWSLPDDDTANIEGVEFYTFFEKAFRAFSTWLNNQQLDDEIISNAVNQGMAQHLKIFEELESLRKQGYVQHKTVDRVSKNESSESLPSVATLYHNASSFFHQHPREFAVGAAVLAGLGVSAAIAYKRFKH